MVIKICNVLTTLLLIVLLVLAVLLVGPNLIGYQNYVVLTGSMEPNIPIGAMVTVDAKADPTKIEPEQVITYQLSGTMLSTHRVVENNTDERYFITKGDANQNADLIPIAYEQLVGRVVYSIPYFGYLIGKIQSRDGILIVAVVLVIVILLTFIPMAFKAEKNKPDLISPRFIPASKIVSKKRKTKKKSR